MPVTSNEVASLISHQNAGFMGNASFANQISQHSNPFIGLNSRSIAPDIRQSAALNMAPGAIQGASSGLSAMGTGASLGAAFGLLPRVLDPFSMTAANATAGFGSSGVAGAVGIGAMTVGAYFAIGKAASFATEQFIQGAQQQVHMMGTAQANYGSSGMRMGPMSLPMSAQMANTGMGMVDQANRAGLGHMMATPQMANVMSIGMQGGAFQGINSMNGFNSAFTGYTANSLQMAGVMGGSVEQGAQQINAMRNQFGFSAPMSVGFMGQMGTMVSRTGMGADQQMNFASQGSSLFSSMGLSRAQGAKFGLGLAQRIALAGKEGNISESDMNDSGGVSELNSRFTTAGFRSFNSSQGRRLMASMLNDEGELDPLLAQQATSGGLSRDQIISRSQKFLSTKRGRAMFSSNFESNVGAFLSSQGPEGILGGLETMGSNLSSEENNSQMRSITGLSGRDLNMMKGLNNSSGDLKRKIMSAANEGLSTSLQGRNISQIIDTAVEQLITGPIKQKFQGIGREVASGVSTYIEEVTRDMTGMQQSGPNVTTGNVSRAFKLSMLGGGNISRQMYGADIGDPTGNSRQFGRSEATTGLGAAFNSFLPMGIDHLQAGGSIHDLPAFGLGGMDNGLNTAMRGEGAAVNIMAGINRAGMNDGVKRMLASGMIEAGEVKEYTGKWGNSFLGKTLNRGLAGNVGAAIGEGGKFMGDIQKGAGWSKWGGVFGIGGKGFRGAGANLAEYGMKGMGGALKGFSSLAGKAFLPLELVNQAMNIPDYMREGVFGMGGGMIGASEGISGDLAEALTEMNDMGYTGGFSSTAMGGNASDRRRYEKIRGRGGIAIVGNTSGGLSGGSNSFMDIVTGGLFREGAEVRQKFVDESAIKKQDRFWNSGISDLSALKEASGLSGGGLKSMALSMEKSLNSEMINYKSSDIMGMSASQYNNTRNEKYMNIVESQGNAGLSRFMKMGDQDGNLDNINRLRNLAGAEDVRDTRDKFNRGLSRMSYSQGMSASQFDKMFSTSMDQGVTSLADKAYARVAKNYEAQIGGIMNSGAGSELAYKYSSEEMKQGFVMEDVNAWDDQLGKTRKVSRRRNLTMANRAELAPGGEMHISSAAERRDAIAGIRDKKFAAREGFDEVAGVVSSQAQKILRGMGSSERALLIEQGGGKAFETFQDSLMGGLKTQFEDMAGKGIGAAAGIPRQMQMAAEMISQGGMREIVLAGSHALEGAARGKETEEFRKGLREGSDRYTDSIKADGASLKDVIGSLGFNKSAEIGDLMHRFAMMGAGEATHGELEKMKNEMRMQINKLSPDEAQELSLTLQDQYGKSSDPLTGEMLSMTRSNGMFKQRMKRELKNPSAAKNKLAIAAELAGGGKAALTSLGLAGSEQHKKYVKDYMAGHGGALPPSAKLAYENAMANNLRHGGLSLSESRRMGAEGGGMLDQITDKGGFDKNDMESAWGAKAMERAGVARAGASGGSSTSSNGPGAEIDAFVKKMKTATDSLSSFSGVLDKLTPNQSTNPQLQSTVPTK